MVDICIYYHFKKDERTEADRSVCLIWFFFFFWVVFVFIPCSFHASKPMWKLYLVWAILSSVTLLYIISNRCNVMSTIKTHKNGTCWHGFIWFSPFLFLNLPFAAQHIQVEMKTLHWVTDRRSFAVSRSAGVKCGKRHAGHCFWILTGSEDWAHFYSFVSLTNLFLAWPLTVIRYHSQLVRSRTAKTVPNYKYSLILLRCWYSVSVDVVWINESQKSCDAWQEGWQILTQSRHIVHGFLWLW